MASEVSRRISSNRYDAIVIGAGINGLTAATVLARAGRKALVLERRPIPGGLAACEEFHPGYRAPGALHDTTGVLPDVVEQLNLKQHGLRREPNPPSVFISDGDRPGLLLHHDPQQAADELNSAAPNDVQAYADFRAFVGRIRSTAMRFYRDLPPDWLNDGKRDWSGLLSGGIALRRLGKKDMMELLRVASMSLADWLDERFDGPLIKSALAVPALHGYFGGPLSPGTCGGFFRYETLATGHVIGGPQPLVDALAAAAKAAGVEILTSKPVSRISVEQGATRGVLCEDGDTIAAALVLSSCDPKQTLLNLLDAHLLSPTVEHGVHAIRSRGLAARVNLALSKPLRFRGRPDLTVEYARIGRPIAELERAFDAAKYRRFNDAPILDIFVASASAPNAAPPGHASVSILVHAAPYDLEGGWNNDRRTQLGDTVVKALSAHTIDLESAIVARQVLTPVDLEQKYALTGGHLFHGEHALDQLLVRPTRHCPRYATPIDGLYLCGSGAHPGGGITAAPGFIAARTILKSPTVRT